MKVRGHIKTGFRKYNRVIVRNGGETVPDECQMFSSVFYILISCFVETRTDILLVAFSIESFLQQPFSSNLIILHLVALC
jgi:hypothetical protein